MKSQQTSGLSSWYEEREKMEGEEPARNTHAYNRKEMVEGGKTKQAENSFLRDAGKLWNRAPTEIKRGTHERVAK